MCLLASMYLFSNLLILHWFHHAFLALLLPRSPATMPNKIPVGLWCLRHMKSWCLWTPSWTSTSASWPTSLVSALESQSGHREFLSPMGIGAVCVLHASPQAMMWLVLQLQE